MPGGGDRQVVGKTCHTREFEMQNKDELLLTDGTVAVMLCYAGNAVDLVIGRIMLWSGLES